jgi:hypothetical protein
MPDPTLDEHVQVVFDAFTRASDELDLEALGELFDDPFLAADPDGARPVPRQLFLQALPRRAEQGPDAGAPVRLSSSFLLRRDGDRLTVVLYLNHQDLRGVLSGA